MPEVPTYLVPRVMPDRAPNVYQHFDTNADMFGAAIGRGLSQLGEGISSFEAALRANGEKMRNERAYADANNAVVNASIEAGKLRADYHSLEGKNAADGYDSYMASLEAIRQKHLDALGDDKAKKLFDNDFTRTLIYDANSAAGHAATQNKKYTSDQSASRVQLAINDSASRFGDEAAFNQNLQVIDKEMRARGLSEGWSSETLENNMATAKGKAWAARIREMSIYNPLGAQNMLQDHRHELLPDDAVVLENAIRTSRDSMGVKQAMQYLKGGFGAQKELTDGMISTHGVLQPIVGVDLLKQPLSGREPGSRAFGGGRHGQYHTAFDAPAPIGTPIVAIDDGRIRAIRASPSGYGLLVDIEYPDGTVHRMAHLSRYGNIAIGQSVPKGTVIAYSGNSGNAGDFAHVHYEIIRGEAYEKYGGRPPGREVSLYALNQDRIDPLEYFYGKKSQPIGFQPGQGDLISRMIQVESGGRAAISPAGALGPMQILPETARIAAKQMGVPFDLRALRYDYAYNVQMGKFIMNGLLQHYDGNETLALAAYNAGQGRVDQWIKQFGDPRTGAISNEAWAAKIPIKETREYIPKVLGASGRDYGQVSTQVSWNDMPLSAKEQAGIQLAQQVAPFDPVFESNLLSAIRSEDSTARTAKNEAQEAAFSTLVEQAISKKATDRDQLLVDDQTRQMYSLLDGGQKENLETLFEKNAKPDKQFETPDMIEEYGKLRGGVLNGTTTLSDITKSNLTPELMKQLTDLLTTPAKKKAATTDVNLNSALATVKTQLSAAGLLDKKKKEALDLFVSKFSDELANFGEKNKRKPTQAEIYDLSKELLLESEVRPYDPNWWPFNTQKGKVFKFEMSKEGLKERFNLSDENAEIMLQAQVPVDAKRAITQSYTQKMGEPPSDEVIWQIYSQQKAAREQLEQMKEGIKTPEAYIGTRG